MAQHANRSSSVRGNQSKNLVSDELPSFSLGLTQDKDFNLGSTNIMSKEGVTVEELRSKHHNDPKKIVEIMKRKALTKSLSPKPTKFQKLMKRRKSDEKGECRKIASPVALDCEFEQEKVEEVMHDQIYMTRVLPKFSPHTGCHMINDIEDRIKSMLTKNQYKMFCTKNIFDFFMKKKDCVVQTQLGRCIMSPETRESSISATVILAKGTILHFTPREFALVTGLNYVSNKDDFVFDEERPNRIIDQYFDGSSIKTKTVNHKKKNHVDPSASPAKKKLKPHPKGVDEQTPKRTPQHRAAKMPSVKTPIYKSILTKTTLHENRKKINQPDSKKSIPIQSPAPSSFSSEDEDVVVSKKVFDKFCEKVWQEFDDIRGLLSSRFDQMMNAINENKVTEEMAGYQSNNMNDVYNDIDGYNEHNDDVMNKETIVEMNLNKPVEDELEVNDVDKSKLDQQHMTPVHISEGANDESNVDQDLPDFQITLPNELLPSLNAYVNLEQSIIVHPSANEAQQTPMHVSRLRRPFRYKESPFTMNFGSADEKNWFYVMNTPSQTWSDEQIDVCFYYLRKKFKYDPNSSYKFSTVDYNFMNIVSRLFDVYRVDDASLNADGKEYHLNEYISGFRMHTTVPWHTIDHMFISVHVKAKHHWVLVVISFNHRCIYVYDSLLAAGHDAVVLSKIEKLAEMDPFGVSVVENVPQQPSGSLDCGLYMITYAECLTFGEGVPLVDFDPDLIRIRYASLVWDYGTRKAEAEAQSDDEAPMRPLWEIELTEGTEVHDI
ncbi:hypothetical protein FXO37_32973 [Capsicum annuum]|nr:hypothetical protein FXO37_32973 [Capsicum annuum]